MHRDHRVGPNYQTFIAKIDIEYLILSKSAHAMEGMIGLILYYSYTNHEMKSAVDQSMLSHLDGSYIWAALSDSERAHLIMVAPKMAAIKSYVEWTKQVPARKGSTIRS